MASSWPHAFAPQRRTRPAATTTASFTVSATPRLKGPIYNPYDKFTQPEFDSWIDDLTGTLRRALGHVQDENDAPSIDPKGNNKTRTDLGDISEDVDSEVDDTFSEMQMRRTVDKGKARDPREGPGFGVLGVGSFEEPIDLASDSEEEEEEVQRLSLLAEDDEEDDDEEEEEEEEEDVDQPGTFLSDISEEDEDQVSDTQPGPSHSSPAYELIDYSDDESQAESDDGTEVEERLPTMQRHREDDDEEVIEDEDDEVEGDEAEDEVVEEVAEVKERISAPQIHRNDGEEDEEYDEDEDEDGEDYGEEEDEEDVYEDDEVYEDRRRAHARNREVYEDANEPETLELSDDAIHEDQHATREVDDEEEFSQQDMPRLPSRPQLASHEVYDLGDDEDELESSDDDSVVESSPPQEKIPPPSALEEPSSSPRASHSPPPAPAIKSLDPDELELAYPSDSLEADTDQMEVDSDIEEKLANDFTEPTTLPTQQPEIIEFDLEDDSEMLAEKSNAEEPHAQDDAPPEVASALSVPMDITEAHSDSYHQPDLSLASVDHVEGDFLLQFEVEEPALLTTYKEDSDPILTLEPETADESLALELEPTLDVHPSTSPPRQESPEIILDFSPENLSSRLSEDPQERTPDTFQFAVEEPPAPTFFSLESQTEESLPKEHLPQFLLEDYSASLEQYMPSVLEAAFGEMQDQSTVSFEPPPAQFSSTIEDTIQYIEFEAAPVLEVTRDHVETPHTDVEILVPVEDTLLAQPTEESVGLEMDEEPERLLPREQSPAIIPDTEMDQLPDEAASAVAISIPVQNPPDFDDSMDASFEEIQEDDMQVDVPPSIVEEPSVDLNPPETHHDDVIAFEGPISEPTVELDDFLARPDDNFSIDVEPTVSIVEAGNATPDITEPNTEIEPVSITVPAGIEAGAEEESLTVNVGPSPPSPTAASHTLPLDEVIDPTSSDEQPPLVEEELPLTKLVDEQEPDAENELERADVDEQPPSVEEFVDTVEQSPMQLDSPLPTVHVELPSEDVPEVSIEHRSPTPETALLADEESTPEAALLANEEPTSETTLLANEEPTPETPETALLVDEEPAAIDPSLIQLDLPQLIVDVESPPRDVPEASRHSSPIPFTGSVVELTTADSVVLQEAEVEELAFQDVPTEVPGLEAPAVALVEEEDIMVELETSVREDIAQAEDELTIESTNVETQPSLGEEIFTVHQDVEDMVQEAEVGVMPEDDSDVTPRHGPQDVHSPVAEAQQLLDVMAEADVVEHVHTVEVEMGDVSILGHEDGTNLPDDNSETVEEDHQHPTLESNVVDEHSPEPEIDAFDIDQESQVVGEDVLSGLQQLPQQSEDTMVWESQETIMTETVIETEAVRALSPPPLNDTVEPSSATVVQSDPPVLPPTPTVTETILEKFEARVPSPTSADPLEDSGTSAEQTAAVAEKTLIRLPLEQESLDAPASLPTPPEERIPSREPSPKPDLETVEQQESAIDHSYPDEERLTPVPPSSDEVTGNAQQPSAVSGDETPKAQDRTPTDDREEDVQPPVREEDTRDEVVAPSSPLSTISQRSKSPLFTPPASPRSRNTEDVQGNVCHRCTFVNELTDVRCRICYTKLRARSTKDDNNGGGPGPSSRKSQSMGSLSKPDSRGSSSASSSAGPSSLANTNLPLGRSLTLTIPARRSSQGGLPRPSALGQSVITAPGDPSDVFNESPRKPSRTYAHRDHKYRDTEGSVSAIGKRKRNEPSSSKGSAVPAKEKGKQRATSPAPSDATSISSKGAGKPNKPKRTKSLAKGKLAVRSASIASTATDKSEKTPTASVATPKSTTTQFWPSSLLYGNSQPTRRHQHHLPVAAADGSTDALYSASPVTRSNCKYRRISLPRYEGGPRIEFLVPGCTLGDAELMEEEEIVDCGDVNVEQASRAIQDLGNLDFDAYLMGILRQLVGLDLLREQEVFYLPKIGEDPKEFRRQRKLSVGLTLTSPKSQAPMSSPLTPSIVGRRVVDVRESDSEEEEESSGSEQSPVKPKRAGKTRQIRRLAKDALEYKPTMEESDDDVQAESSARGRKNGLKRTRTQEDDGEDGGKKVKRRR